MCAPKKLQFEDNFKRCLIVILPPGHAHTIKQGSSEKPPKDKKMKKKNKKIKKTKKRHSQAEEKLLLQASAMLINLPGHP